MIIFISSSPFLGGAEYQLLDLVSGLVSKYKIGLMLSSNSPMINKLPKKNILVETFEFGSTLGKFRGLNILDPKNLFRIKKLKRIFNNLNKAENNLIVTTDYKELILVKLTKSKNKHLHTQHPEFPKWLRSNPFLRKIVVDSLNETDSVVVDCKAIENHLKSFGVNSGSIRVIYNGVDANLFSPPTVEEKDSAKKQLGLQNKLVIGINARINSGKGYEILIKAFGLLVQELENAHLVSIGGGNNTIRRRIDTLVKKEKLDARVSFLGSWNQYPIVYLSVHNLNAHLEKWGGHLP